MKTININKVKDAIISALKEDIGTGDITSNSLISPTTYCRAKIIFKEAAMICGLNTIKLVYSYLDRRIVVRLLVKDGKRASVKSVIALMKLSISCNDIIHVYAETHAIINEIICVINNLVTFAGLIPANLNCF